MHYNYILGSYDDVIRVSKAVVNVHYEEWKDSSCPDDDTATRFLQLCGTFGKNAYWIIITDAFNKVIGTITVGEEPDALRVYNFLIEKEWREIRWGEKIFDLVFSLNKNKKEIYSLVKKDDALSADLYKKYGAVQKAEIGDYIKFQLLIP